MTDITMKNWQKYLYKSELQLMQAVFSETHRTVRSCEPPSLPVENWNDINWLSDNAEKMLDEYLDMAKDMEKVLDNIADEVVKKGLGQ
tara:strand:- start:7288 stop:7551 length:264 start_codon:yes stop_codon:yes gene_type:complete